MDRHLSDGELEGYRNRTAAPRELIAASGHLASCDDCYKRFKVEDRTAATYEFVREYLATVPVSGPDHLLYEQMASYADESLDPAEAEIVKSHIKECRECDSDIQDLLKIKGSLEQAGGQIAAAGPARVAAATAPAPVPTAQVRTAAVRAKSIRGPGWGVGSIRYWQSPGFRLAIQAACVIVLAAVVAWTVTRGLRSEVDRLEREAAALQQANDQLRKQAGDVEKLQTQLAELERDNDRLRQQGGGSDSSGVSLKDGGAVIALAGGGGVVGLEGVPPKYQDLIKTALSSGKVNIAMVPAASEGRVGTTLGGNEQEKFNVLSPLRSVVESDRPVLRWQALGGATGYVVFLRDTATGEEIESDQVGKTEWAPEKGLARGHVYNWMVEAAKDGKRVRAPSLDKPYASFKVLDDAGARELREAKQKWAGSHLLLGVLYARAGVRDQAVKEFEALAAENPGSGLAKKLLSGAR